MGCYVDLNMNEWELQHYLTKKWRKENLYYNGFEYHLVCWELMFPSWDINDKRTKWNEISIDFILYSIELSEFLCVELKNIIKGKKNLLSAYCQATQRTIHFIEQYDVKKLNRARNRCHTSSINERGGIDSTIDEIKFSKKPAIKRVLMAKSFQSNASGFIDSLNALNRSELQNEYSIYSTNKEFERFNAIKEEQFNLIEHNPLFLIQLD